MEQFSAWRLVIAVGLGLMVLSPIAAQAQGRPDARTMTCAQARSLVTQAGAVVLTTGQYTYDRYVANERFCPLGEMAERTYVQTRDAQSCYVGYRCVLDTRRDDRWPWRPRRR